MAFDVGGFAEGLSSGMQTMADLRSKSLNLQAQKLKLDADKAKAMADPGFLAAMQALGSLQAGGGRGNPGQPGTPPPAANQNNPTAPQAGPPAAAALPGATPMPQGVRPPSGGPPPGNVAPMQRPPQQQAAPPPSPAPGPTGAGGPSGSPASADQGSQALQEAMRQSQMALKVGIDAINKSMPGAKPAAKAAALREYIDTIKELDPMTRALSVAQAKYYMDVAKIGETHQYHEETHEDRVAAVGERATAAAESYKAREDGIAAALKRQSMADATRLQAAQISQAGADHRADEYVAQRDRALDAGLDEKEWATGVSAELKREGYDQSYINSIIGGQSRSISGKVNPPAQRPRPALPAAPSFRGPSATRGAPKPGSVEGGYRFKGGDPADPKNWAKVSNAR